MKKKARATAVLMTLLMVFGVMPFLPAGTGAAYATEYGSEFQNIAYMTENAELKDGDICVFVSKISSGLTLDNPEYRLLTAAVEYPEDQQAATTAKRVSAPINGFAVRNVDVTDQKYMYRLHLIEGNTDTSAYGGSTGHYQGYTLQNVATGKYLDLKQALQPPIPYADYGMSDQTYFAGASGPDPTQITVNGIVTPTYPYVCLSDQPRVWYWNSKSRYFYTLYRASGEDCLGGNRARHGSMDSFDEKLVIAIGDKHWMINWTTYNSFYTAYIETCYWSNLFYSDAEHPYLREERAFKLTAQNFTDIPAPDTDPEIPVEQYRDPLWTLGRNRGLSREQCAEANYSTAMLGGYDIGGRKTSAHWSDSANNREAREPYGTVLDPIVCKRVKSPVVTMYPNGGNGDVVTKPVSTGNALTYDPPTHDTMAFMGWSRNPNGQIMDEPIIVKEDMTLYAQWGKPRVSYSAWGGTVTADDNYQEHMDVGDTFTLTATANQGCTFQKWLVNGQYFSNSPTQTFTVSGNLDIEAVFQKNFRDVQVDMQSSYPYTGEPVVLNETLTYDGRTLDPADYRVRYGPGTLTEDPPTATGTYTAYFNSQENDWTNSALKEFQIVKAPVELHLESTRIICTQTGTQPVLRGVKENASVTYEYKEKDAEDSTYANGLPTEVGEFTVRATVAGTANYNGGSATASYTVRHDKSSAGEEQVTKATFDTDGSISVPCGACGKTAVSPVSHIDTVELAETSYTYDGKAKKPAVTATDANGDTIDPKYYTVDYTANVNAGTAKALVTFNTYYEGTKELGFTISPANLSKVTFPAIPDKTYTGKATKPTFTAKYSGMSVKSSVFSVTYSNNKNVGKARMVIKGKGNYTGSKTVYFKINPKGTSIKSLTRASKAATVKWTKQSAKMSTSRISGYQILLATNSKFTTGKKTVNVAGYSKVSKKVTGLKGGKKYYVKIRTYKTVSGVKYYSPWSKVKTVTTKK